LEIMIITRYLIAGRMIRPVQSILDKVNDVANGHFGARLKIKSKDELGLLARRINMMARNLSIYTNQLQQTYEENRAMKEYLESFINQTADAIHVV
ncbi:HAMP domain-containing protein, partial [Bacillus cereus]|nr:HAMP domain-containing protein [Bacillus cereus]